MMLIKYYQPGTSLNTCDIFVVLYLLSMHSYSVTATKIINGFLEERPPSVLEVGKIDGGL